MNLSLKNYTTFKVGGNAYRILNIRNQADIISAVSYADKCNKKLIIIGEGSNSIFSDQDDLFIIGSMQIKGISIIEDADSFAIVRVSAGESWDDFVLWSIEQGLSGIELLSGIPGTVGAAPIQNIGAYGKELSDVLVHVTAYKIKEKRFRVTSLSQCELSYRDSIFKRNPNEYIISEITVKLHKTKPRVPQYESIKNKFPSNNPTSLEIRSIVLQTRAEKIPDYKIIPNCGSFFKNPIITKNQLEELHKLYPDMPYFEVSETEVKLYAGWLIEHSNWQSVETQNIKLAQTSKLVLTNIKDATFAELLSVIENIKREILQNFNISIEPEPNLFQ